MNNMRRGLMEAITRELIDEGRIIEAGFASYKIAVMNPNAGTDQIIETRRAFFAGAQHLFASIMSVLEPGSEPTVCISLSRIRITQIHEELDRFIVELKASIKEEK